MITNKQTIKRLKKVGYFSFWKFRWAYPPSHASVLRFFHSEQYFPCVIKNKGAGWTIEIRQRGWCCEMIYTKSVKMDYEKAVDYMINKTLDKIESI